MNSLLKIRGRLWVMILVPLVTLVACGSEDASDPAGQVEGSDTVENSPDLTSLWEPFRYEGVSEVTPEMPASDLAKESSVVVRGEFTGTCGTRKFVDPDVPENVIEYPCLVLTAADVLYGEMKKNDLPVEFSFGPQDLKSTDVPAGEVVAFVVKKKGEGEEDYYRLVNSTSLWSSTERAEVDQPVAEAPPGKSSVSAGVMLSDEPTWEDFVSEISRELKSS